MGGIIFIILAALLPFLFLILYFFWVVVTALTVYILHKVYPLALGIAKWVTARRNCLPFFLFMLITIAVTIILLIGAYYFTANVHAIGFIVIFLLIMILGIVVTIFSGGLTLAIIMWIVRLSHWAFDGFRRAMHGKPVHEFATVGVKPSYRVRRRLEGLYPSVSSEEEKARQKAEAKAAAKAKEKAKAVAKAKAKALAKELAKAQAIEKARAKELAKAQSIAKARAKALADAQTLAKGKKIKPEETTKPKKETTKPKKETAKPKKETTEPKKTTKLRRRRRLRPKKKPGQEQ